MALKCNLAVLLMLSGITSWLQAAQVSLLQQDEARWARRLHLKLSYVEALVNAAGYANEEARIEHLDVRHLRSRSQSLLVMAAGNGHCLDLIVLGSSKTGVQKIWQQAEMPGGGGFCHEGARTGDFQAHATPSGDIVVDIPKDENGHLVIPGKRQLVYRWNGQTYTLVNWNEK